MDKSEIRKQMLKRRRELSENRIREESLKAEVRFCGTAEFLGADRLFAYRSVNGEMDTMYIIRKAFELGKEVYLPKVTGKQKMEFYRILSEDDVEIGKFGILEPISNEMPDWKAKKSSVMIVPGVAFDEKGNRIGYGAGFYDRYFERIFKERKNMTVTALAYEFQIVDSLPAEEFDWGMDRIITPDRCIEIENLILT